ncbi:MAG TPA: hypothetical protein VF170_05735 [Planctomycetaceae bacterium]
MTRLRVYRGPETTNRISRIGDDRPDVIPFAAFASAGRNRLAAREPLSRAKALHENRRCRTCGHGSVDPVTLNDGLRDGSGQYIPGTATLVGFHCRRCHAEWPVYGE